MPARVRATTEALEVIERLRAVHGPLVFFQSGGCCDGSAPMCLHAGEFLPAPGDVHLGHIGGAAFYIDADQYERWRRPAFVLDVAPGAAESFSLQGLQGLPLLSRRERPRASRSRASRACTSSRAGRRDEPVMRAVGLRALFRSARSTGQVVA